MSLNQLYTSAAVSINGQLLTEASRVRVERNLDAQEVKTLAKGFAGISPGAPMLRVTVDNAVPARDFELNPGKYMLRYEEVEVVIFAAANTLVGMGYIIDDTFEMAVSAAASLGFTTIGAMEDWITT